MRKWEPLTLNFDRDGRRALVKDAVLGAVVKEARHADTLLLATRKGTKGKNDDT